MKETTFDQFAKRHAVDLPLSQISGALGEGRPVRIGIEAEHFLTKFAGKEPLNGALGGDPMSLEDKVLVELSELQKLNCEVIFYFHGCSYGPYIEPFTAASAAAETNKRAFVKYEEANPKEAIEIFKANDFSDKFPVLEWLKTVLGKSKTPFMVAPFSAHAQMVDAFKQNAIDAYYASTEIFLFGAQQIIWNVDIKMESSKKVDGHGETVNHTAINLSDSTFKVLDWEHLSAPGQFNQPPSSDIMVKDAMILTGSSRLPMYPPLAEMLFPAVVDRIAGFHGQIENMIRGLTSVDRKSMDEYWEKFVATSASITHMVILNHINETAPRTGAHAPGDLQQALAARLPDELSYYMSTGLISPRILNWCLTHKIAITAPFDGGDQLYRKIIRETLNPVRQQTYGVLANSLNRYFNFTSNSTEYWFGAPKQEFKGHELSINQHSLTTWRVRDKDIADAAKELDVPKNGLLFALASLGDAKFPPKTISKKDTSAGKWDADPLTSESELVTNTTWRMLMLRDYVGKNHELTPWGKVALAALRVTGPSNEQCEAIFVAVELLRAGHLSPKTLLADDLENERDKNNIRVISKVLTTGQMSHHAKGYSGPLSRNLLSFHSSVSAMRTTLRDLTEATMANLFLCGDGKRIRDDYVQLAKDLPFQGRFSCGLGILMSTYLDGYQGTAVSKESLTDINNVLEARMHQYCAHLLVKPSLERAVNLWDAFMAAIRASGDLVPTHDKTAFEELDHWFAGRRPGTKQPVLSDAE